MNLPHRRVDDLNSFDQDVARAVRLNKIRSQVFALAEDSILHRYATLAVIKQLADAAARQRFIASSPPRPGPPVLIGRSTIERAAARDRDVFLLEGVDQRRVVHALSAFEARVNNGQVFFRISAELECRSG